MTYPVAVFGASGYAGGEIIRLVDGHPDLEIVYLGGHNSAGSRLAAVQPHLGGGKRKIGELDPKRAKEADLVFLALPHGASAKPAMQLVAAGKKVIDLGSDFRLWTESRYQEAYGDDHPHPDQLGAWVYGLPELFGKEIADADRVAAPGCFPTSVVLALAPLLDGDLVEPGVVVDSLTGVSGAGRSVKEHLMYGAVDEGVRAYGVLTHRHRPEMEQGLEHIAGHPVTVLFTPHLVPMQRGILTTCYVPAKPDVTAKSLTSAMRSFAKKRPFVELVDEPPQTRWVVGSNRCLVSVHLDERTNMVITISAIDNLVKGTSGQGVQCANLMLGLDETAGLPIEGWMP